jgi:hypothetical protein
MQNPAESACQSLSAVQLLTPAARSATAAEQGWPDNFCVRTRQRKPVSESGAVDEDVDDG